MEGIEQLTGKAENLAEVRLETETAGAKGWRPKICWDIGAVVFTPAGGDFSNSSSPMGAPGVHLCGTALRDLPPYLVPISS